MSQQVKIPTVGRVPSRRSPIANWLKKDGDVVKMDEVIAELESDKATFELTAPQAGILKIAKQQGETVPIGAVICEITDSSAAASAPAPAAPAASPSKPAAGAPSPAAPTAKPAGGQPTGGIKEMKVPAVGESITEVTISTWIKKEGDFVTLDEVIAEVESDKATFELPAEATGILRIVAQEKTVLKIGGLICKIEITEGASAKATGTVAQPASPAVPASGTSYAAGYPSPAAAKILDEKGVATTQVQGSGVGGRITKDDAVKVQPSAAKLAEAKTPVALGATRYFHRRFA